MRHDAFLLAARFNAEPASPTQTPGRPRSHRVAARIGRYAHMNQPRGVDDGGDATIELLARARLGDRTALEQLFARHVPLLRSWASGRLPRWARDIADTSDLVQETVVTALKNLDAFEPRGEGALQAYLRTAVVNR